MTSGATANGVRNRWNRLEWVIDGNIQNAITKAHESALVAIEDSDDDVFWFADFGSDWVKNYGPFPSVNCYGCYDSLPGAQYNSSSIARWLRATGDATGVV